MPITMSCPNPACGKASRLPDGARGRRARCPACGHTFAVPASAAATQAQPPADTLLTTPPSRKPAASTPQTLPERLGRFLIKERLGAGAFGAVYRAHDPQLGREVALKVPHPGSLTEPRQAERFLREGRAVAGLHHPHIVPVFDAGQDGAVHYLAAAFIPGRTLAHECAGGPLAFRRAAELVRQLAEALAYAHTKGIIHRDVKPANVLLDERGEAHLADFGLAHRADEGDEALTREGAVLGTPAYMAPEQAEGQHGEPLPASDQYSLGAVLYELLTGEAPFSGPPAIVLYNVLHCEPEPVRKLNAQVPPELEAVCLKALAKRPEDRYGDCAALADDLRRWGEGLPVQARPLRMAERCLRWLKREPRLAALAGLTVVCLLLTSVLAVARAQELSANKERTRELVAQAAEEKQKAATQKEQAQARQNEGEQSAREAKSFRAKADRQRQEARNAKEDQDRHTQAAVQALQQAAEQEREARRKLYRAHLEIARTAFDRKDTKRTRASLARHFPAPGQDDVRGADWHDLWIKLPSELTAADHLAHLSCVAIKGSTLASGSADQTVRIRYGSERPTAIFTDLPGTITALAFDPPGWNLASAGGKTVRVCFTNGGRVRAHLSAHTATVTALAFRSDSKALASAASGEKVIVWTANPRFNPDMSFDGEATTWKPVSLEGKPGVVRGLAFSPDGKILGAGSDADVWLWDVRTGQRRSTLSGQERVVTCVAFRPDGKTVAAGGADGTVKLWDVAGGKARITLRGHPGPVHAVAFSPDGRTLVTGSEDDRIRFWDADGGKELGSVAAAGPGICALAFGREEPWVTVVSRGLKRKTFPLNAGRLRLVLADGGKVACVAFSPDSKTLAVGKIADGKIRLYDLLTGKQVTAFEGKAKDKGVAALAFSPDGKLLAAGGEAVCLWDVGTGKERLTISCRPSALAFSPDGKTLAADDGYGGALIRLWDPATGKEKRSLGRLFGPRLVFSPDGKTLAASSALDGLKLWDVASGEEKHLQGGPGIVRVAFSPDGKTLAVAEHNGAVWWWDLATGQRKPVLSKKRPGTDYLTTSMAFSPDLRLLACGMGDRTIAERDEDRRLWGVTLWDLTTGKEWGAIKGAHRRSLSHVVLSPDGRTLVSVGGVGVSHQSSTIKVWDVWLLPDFDKR